MPIKRYVKMIWKKKLEHVTSAPYVILDQMENPIEIYIFKYLLIFVYSPARFRLITAVRRRFFYN